jgi:hypothetical protein
MGILETLALAGTALAGGLIGAASAAYIAGEKFGKEFDTFRTAFRAFAAVRTDEASLGLVKAFDQLDAAWRAFGSSLSRLGRAATPRK